METIKVLSCTKKRDGVSSKDGKPYSIYEIETDKGKMQCFSELEAGEHTGDVVPNANPQYAPTFKPKKAFGGGKFVSPYNQYRIAAMNGAVQMVVAKVVEAKQLEATYKLLLKTMEEA